MDQPSDPTIIPTLRRFLSESARLDRRCGIPLLALCMFVLLVSSSPAADPFVGKITAIDSGIMSQVVNIVRAGKNGYAKAKIGDAVFVGDTVKTGSNVKTQIELPDGSLINIGTDSTIQMKANIFAPAEAKRNYVFKALKGMMRFIIQNRLKQGSSGLSVPWKDSNVTIETTTAVAGVRGTDFAVTIMTEGPIPAAEIAVFDGVVRVRSTSLSIKETVILQRNQVSTVRFGSSPAAASLLSEARRRSLTDSTTPARTEPRKESPTGKKGAPRKYTKDDAERDLASGSTVAEVLDRAADSGMSVSEMVAALLDAGVEPYVLVYTALTEGFQAEAVVSAAIREGALLNSVITAAMMAGAEQNSIISGAADAGAPPSAIATAFANADAPGAPVFGYASPVAALTAGSIVIQSSTVITPSGATPSASPYKP